MQVAHEIHDAAQPVCNRAPRALVLRNEPEDAHAIGVGLQPLETDGLLGVGVDDCNRDVVAALCQFLDDAVVEPQVLRRIPDEQDLHDAVTRPPDSASRSTGADETLSGTTVAPPSRAKTCWATCR